MHNDHLNTESAAVYAVDLVVEYLPGLEIKTVASAEFSCSKVANASLQHIRKTYPGARLRTDTYLDPTDEMKAHFRRVEQQTERLKSKAFTAA